LKEKESAKNDKDSVIDQLQKKVNLLQDEVEHLTTEKNDWTRKFDENQKTIEQFEQNKKPENENYENTMNETHSDKGTKEASPNDRAENENYENTMNETHSEAPPLSEDHHD